MKLVHDMDWDKGDVVFLFVITSCFFVFFLYAYGLALVKYPQIVGFASLTAIMISLVIWSLNKYFKIKKLEAKPTANEILRKKYAKGELTEEELDEKMETILEK